MIPTGSLFLLILSWIVVWFATREKHNTPSTYDPKGWKSLKEIKDEIKENVDGKPQEVTDENIQGYQYNGLL